MKKYLLSHLKYYITLFAIQALGFIVLLSLAGFRELQIIVIFVSALAYIAWAILHHYLHHDLTAKIVVEYVLFGVFGVIVSLLYFK